MGTTVGIILLSYDIATNHVAVKNQMKSLGYYENWKIGSGPTYYLPNTTLWHLEKSSDAAIADIKNVCIQLNVKLEKAIAVRASDFVGY